MRRILLSGGLGFCIGLIWGCAVMPPEVNNQALPPVPLSVLINDVNQYRGDTVILGGYVVSVENKADHTFIVVVQAPLGVGQKPKKKDLSEGRLILEHAGFIDPEVYTKDRQITVGGEILGSSASDRKASYPYLKLQVQKIHLWPVEKPVHDPYWYDDFYPYYYPWWWHPYWYHRHRHH